MLQLELLRHPAATPTDRPPLLFVHGVCHGAWCWAPHYLPYFAALGWEACALSLRGHGRSPGREQLDQWGLDDYVDDVLTTATRLGRKPVLIGHSMGGAITQLALQRNADHFAGAVLLASMPPNGMTLLEKLGLLRGLPGLFAMKHLFDQRALTPAQVNRLPFFDGRLRPDQAQAYAPLLQAESSRAKTDLAGLRILPSEHTLPMLVVGSRQDRLFAAQALQRTATHHRAPLHLLDEGCHDLMLEPDWRASAQVIGKWLDGHWPPTVH